MEQIFWRLTILAILASVPTGYWLYRNDQFDYEFTSGELSAQRSALIDFTIYCADPREVPPIFQLFERHECNARIKEQEAKVEAIDKEMGLFNSRRKTALILLSSPLLYPFIFVILRWAFTGRWRRKPNPA